MLQPVGKAKGKRIARRAPFDENAAAAIYHTLQRLFAHWHKRLIIGLHNAWAEHGVVAKANGKTPLWPWIDDVIDDAIDEPPPTWMRDVADAMAKAYTGASDHTVRQIDLENPAAISIRTTTEATDYAASRAAEMIGKRYDADGILDTNPDSDWAITDTNREVLAREIRDAVALHWDVDKLA
jgi:hypothetical protein